MVTFTDSLARLTFNVVNARARVNAGGAHLRICKKCLLCSRGATSDYGGSCSFGAHSHQAWFYLASGGRRRQEVRGGWCGLQLCQCARGSATQLRAACVCLGERMQLRRSLMVGAPLWTGHGVSPILALEPGKPGINLGLRRWTHTYCCIVFSANSLTHMWHAYKESVLAPGPILNTKSRSLAISAASGRVHRVGVGPAQRSVTWLHPRLIG
jgi:hypothetical protein